MSSPKIAVKGADKLIKKLRAMASPQTANRVMRTVTNAATTPLLKAVKNEMGGVVHLPAGRDAAGRFSSSGTQGSGALKASLAKKVVGRNGNYEGIVGSDISKPGADGKGIAARYLHLVEFGFEHVGGKVVPGQFPLHRGQAAAQGEVARVYAEMLASEIEKEAEKGGR